MSDLRNQVAEFRRAGGSPICFAVVGVNHSPEYTSYERERAWPTDGRKHKHPFQEAQAAEARLQEVRPFFDELLLLRFCASNVAPFPFNWLDEDRTHQEYGAILTRISVEYDRRFRDGDGV